jgi:hypothetical protein
MAWYQDRWWYVERPFPWWLIVAVAVALALLVLGVVIIVEVLT